MGVFGAVKSGASFAREIGGGAFSAAFNLTSGIASPVASVARTVVPPVAKVGNFYAKHGIKTGLEIARFGFRNPQTTAIIGAGLYGIHKLSETGPQQRDMSKEETAQLAMAYGGPSTGFAPGYGSTREALISSTEGLVQGLHSGRHR